MSTLYRVKNEEQLEAMMKKWILYSIMVFLLVLFSCCQKQTSEEVSEPEKPHQPEKIAPIAQSFENMIDMAVVNFQEGEVAKGVELFLDGILLVKPKENWPDGFASIVSAAKEQFQKGNMSEYGENISNALSLIQPAKADLDEEINDASITLDQEPQKTGPAPVAQIFVSMISSAKDEFKNGNADSGVTKILQALLLLTPRTK